MVFLFFSAKSFSKKILSKMFENYWYLLHWRGKQINVNCHCCELKSKLNFWFSNLCTVYIFTWYRIRIRIGIKTMPILYTAGRHWPVDKYQCCGSGMFIPDPGSCFCPSRFPNPKTATKEKGKKNLLSYFFVATIITKLKIILFLSRWRKNLTKNYRTFYP